MITISCVVSKLIGEYKQKEMIQNVSQDTYLDLARNREHAGVNLLALTF